MENLGIAWSGDFNSLKQFVKDVLKLVGEWSQPGGDRKVFAFGSSSISWRKSKVCLQLEGEETITIKKKICELMLEGEITSQRQMNSSSSPEMSAEEIESLRTGQLVNSEAIQSLAESVAQISSILSELKTNSEYKVNGESQTNMKVMSSLEMRNEFEYANLKEDNLIVSEDLTDLNNNKNDQSTLLSNSIIDLTINNMQSSYANAKSTNSIASTNDQLGAEETMTEQVTVIDLVQVYAESPTSEPVNDVTQSLSGTNKVNEHVKVKEHLKKQSLINVDEFKGVDRRRSGMKHFFLAGISDDVHKEQIVSYLKDRNVEPTKISIFNSRQKGAISAKVSVPSSAAPLLDKENFWPKFVRCRPWRKKQQRYSTLV